MSFRLIVGIAYLWLIAVTLHLASGHSLTRVFAVVLLSTMTVFVIVLILAVGWALQEEGTRPKLRLRSLFLLTALAGIYLGMMRWLVEGSRDVPGATRIDSWLVLVPLSVSLIVMSLPSMLFFGEGLLEFANWLIRRRWVRSLLRRRSQRRT